MKDIITLRVEKAASMNCDAIDPGNMMVRLKKKFRTRGMRSTKYNKCNIYLVRHTMGTLLYEVQHATALKKALFLARLSAY